MRFLTDVVGVVVFVDVCTFVNVGEAVVVLDVGEAFVVLNVVEADAILDVVIVASVGFAFLVLDASVSIKFSKISGVKAV